MDDCPNCEYNRQRAQRWREEAYKQSGHPLPERGWVGLTIGEVVEIELATNHPREFAKAIEDKLKEKNYG